MLLRAVMVHAAAMVEARRKVRLNKGRARAARTSPSTVRTDNALRVRFYATVSEEPGHEVDVV